jgi:hypothetical protein
MKIIGTGDREINSIEEWLLLAPPAKGLSQWKDYRSAKELAKCWLRDGIAKTPEEQVRLLHSQAFTTGYTVTLAYPEKETPLDAFKNGRKHDLLTIAEKEDKKIIIAIEAKADESYGDLIESILFKADKPSSNLPRRVEELSQALFGEKSTGDLRYQLLHGVAGALIEAKLRKADYAIFLVHEFHSNHVKHKNLERNREDLNRFVSRLMGMQTNIEPNELVGPITVPGGVYVPDEIPLYIGKVVTVLE